MRIFRTSFALVGILAGFIGGDARGADSIIFDSLGTSTGVGNNGGNGSYGVIGGTSIPPVIREPAFSFTAESTADLTELDISLGYMSGIDAISVYLMSDSGGSPGPILTSWNVSVPSGICCTTETLLGNATLELVSGTQYWTAVLPGAGSTVAFWGYGSGGPTGPLYENEGAGWVSQAGIGEGNVPLGAFRVLGSPVLATPEPDTVALTLVAAMLALLVKLRNRRRQHVPQHLRWVAGSV